MVTQDVIFEPIERERDAFMERLLQSTAGFFDIYAVYLGDRLGFYRMMAGNAGMTSTELASACQANERYVREWLEQQTVSGIVTVEDPMAGALERRYYLMAGRAEVLTDEASLNYLAPLARLLAGAARPLEMLVDAYRNGTGVPFEAYGDDMRQGQALINRSAYLSQLGREWIPSMEDVDEQLTLAPSPRIADIGCGCGWSSIGMAQSYPNVRVDGFDLDEASIHEARRNAEEAGVSDRVRFHLCDAADAGLDGCYDLVTALECIHDLSDPVGVLAKMKRLAGDRGAVLVVDERVGDRFTTEGNDIEWLMYGFSILHCLPAGMCQKPSSATGTVMRTDVLADYATQAGYRRVEVLPIDHIFFRFYRLHAEDHGIIRNIKGGALTGWETGCAAPKGRRHTDAAPGDRGEAASQITVNEETE